MEKNQLPKYNLAEELINSISHGIGALLGIAALVLTIIFSAINNNPIGVISSIIYGITMITMYTISCIYHALSPKLKAKKIFRILDHCNIYVYIAGCYTPFCLSLIGGLEGWIIFGIVWICALIGIVINLINLEKNKKLSIILYLVMGWIILFSYNSLKANLKTPGLILLLAGGIVYSVGAILYLIGSKKRYFHSLFHFFVLAGTILQFFSILLYAI